MMEGEEAELVQGCMASGKLWPFLYRSHSSFPRPLAAPVYCKVQQDDALRSPGKSVSFLLENSLRGSRAPGNLQTQRSATAQ